MRTSCPEVGRSQRPRCQTARRAAAVKQTKGAANRYNVSRIPTATIGCLTDDDPAALSPDRVHLTHGTCRGAFFWGEPLRGQLAFGLKDPEVPDGAPELAWTRASGPVAPDRSRCGVDVGRGLRQCSAR